MNDRELVNYFYRLVFPVSVALFIASAAVHVVTFAPVNVADTFPPVYFLHLGLFALIGPMIFIERVLIKSPSMARYGGKELENPGSGQPDWFWAGCFALGAYAAVNFLIFFITDEGNPEAGNGRYWLEMHGKFVRELTRDEFDAVSARILHGFSGHWLVFYFYAAGWSYIKSRRNSPILDQNK